MQTKAAEEEKKDDDEDDEETIPVHYQEEEETRTGKVDERGQDRRGPVLTAERQRRDSEGRQPGSRKPLERSPRGGRAGKPAATTPSAGSGSSRLTRSAQKRKLHPDKPAERRLQKPGSAKRTRFEELEVRPKPPERRDPYDFSDSQSNKTPSPFKKKRCDEGEGAPALERSRTDGDDGKASLGKDDKTPPVAQVLREAALARRASEPARVTPTGRPPPVAAKPSPAPRPASAVTAAASSAAAAARSRRAPSGRQRQPSEQVRRAQLGEDSSPDFQPDQPRERAGVKFRRSPRKKSARRLEAAVSSPTGVSPYHKQTVRVHGVNRASGWANPYLRYVLLDAKSLLYL